MVYKDLRNAIRTYGLQEGSGANEVHTVCPQAKGKSLEMLPVG